MKSTEELNGTPIKFDKEGTPVLPEGYTKAPSGLKGFKGIAFNKGEFAWQMGSNWGGNVNGYFYAIPDPNYNPGKTEDEVIEAFNATIKELEEELQDVQVAKEAYLRMSKDAETFALIADKYGWFEKDEPEEVEVPKPVEPEFKVGDKVRIKKDAESIPPHSGVDKFSGPMVVSLGKETHIVCEAGGLGWWFVEGAYFRWSENWLEKVVG